MDIVVSDTTALIVFAKSDTLNLLTNLFENIFVPKAVHNELNIKDDVVKFRINRFDRLVLKKIENLELLKNIQQFKLDQGEIEAISLALELNLALIIDEKKGRKIALDQGLKIVGILGILIENYKQKFISFEEAIYYLNLYKKNGLRIKSELEKVFVNKLSV